jgi:hypothetical protein
MEFENDVKCIVCSEISTIVVTAEQWYKWKSGTFIQDAFPHLSANERELLQSGICGKCFDKIYPEIEEED